MVNNGYSRTMKNVLAILFLLFPVYAMAGQYTAAQIEEKIKEIESIEDIFLLRITILNDRLSINEAELASVNDSYRKSLLMEEVKMLKENIEREKATLKRKIDAIEYGAPTPIPAAVDERLKRANRFFQFFQHGKK